MRDCIFTLTMNKSFLFFAIYAILGKEYTGAADSSSYIISNAGLVTLSLIYIFGERFFKKVAPLRKVNLLFYLLPILTGLIYFLESPAHEYGYYFFTLYWVYSFPSIYIGTYVAANKSLNSIAKWLDLTMIILTLGLIISIPKMVLATQVSVGGAGYQTISYMAAFAYSLNLFSLLFKDKYTHFKFCRSKIYIAITYLFLFLQVITVFVSAGRGGFIVLFISTIIMLYLKFKGHFRFGKLLLAALTVLFTVLLLFSILPEDATSKMQQNSERIFSYVSSGGIDMSETSGRDQVYSSAWKLITERPLLGYGIFKYVDVSLNGWYPHNLFLDFLLQGGIIFLLVWMLILIRFFLQYRIMIKMDDNNLILIPIIIFTSVELQFSGTYLNSPLFWFLIAYVFNYKTKINTQIRKDENDCKC